MHLETHALTALSDGFGLPGSAGRLGPGEFHTKDSNILTQTGRTQDPTLNRAGWAGESLVLDGSGSLSQRALLPRKAGNSRHHHAGKKLHGSDVAGGECERGSGEDLEHSQGSAKMAQRRSQNRAHPKPQAGGQVDMRILGGVMA